MIRLSSVHSNTRLDSETFRIKYSLNRHVIKFGEVRSIESNLSTQVPCHLLHLVFHESLFDAEETEIKIETNQDTSSDLHDEEHFLVSNSLQSALDHQLMVFFGPC